MRAQLKAAAERLTGNKLWIERAADLGEVSVLMRRLAPVAITRPLVRIGSKGDGGYLLPDDLDEITACVSPGVSNEVGFDLDIANRGINVYMADASVAGPPVDHPRFHFVRKYLDVHEDDTTATLDTLCASIPSGDRLLQMDIEGAEYRVLLDASDATLQSFRIMAIEFHHLTQMFSAFPFMMIRATFEKLLRFHRVVHIHPNNIAGPTERCGIAIPPVMEFTFYRRDRAAVAAGRDLKFPHPLDHDNVPHHPSVALPACWRSMLK